MTEIRRIIAHGTQSYVQIKDGLAEVNILEDGIQFRAQVGLKVHCVYLEWAEFIAYKKLLDSPKDEDDESDS